jgi:hypothetical protein
MQCPSLGTEIISKLEGNNDAAAASVTVQFRTDLVFFNFKMPLRDPIVGRKWCIPRPDFVITTRAYELLKEIL